MSSSFLSGLLLLLLFLSKHIQRLATESLADPDIHWQPTWQSCHCTGQQSWGAATANGKGITRRTHQTLLFGCRKLSVWLEPYCANSGFTLQPLHVFALQCCSYGLQQTDAELDSHEEKGRTEAQSHLSTAHGSCCLAQNSLEKKTGSMGTHISRLFRELLNVIIVQINASGWDYAPTFYISWGGLNNFSKSWNLGMF